MSHVRSIMVVRLKIALRRHFFFCSLSGNSGTALDTHLLSMCYTAGRYRGFASFLRDEYGGDPDLWPQMEAAIRRERTNYWCCHLLPRLAAFAVVVGGLAALAYCMLRAHGVI